MRIVRRTLDNFSFVSKLAMEKDWAFRPGAGIEPGSATGGIRGGTSWTEARSCQRLGTQPSVLTEVELGEDDHGQLRSTTDLAAPSEPGRGSGPVRRGRTRGSESTGLVPREHRGDAGVVYLRGGKGGHRRQRATEEEGDGEGHRENRETTR
jgi:hypothetical protein